MRPIGPDYFPALLDYLLAGTPFRGLVIRGPMSMCAYIGVPKDHWLAGMDELDFDCHHGVTFQGEGGDGIRPAGWYWYGWDYAHYTDRIELPEGDLARLPPEIAQELTSLTGNHGKKWTLAEVEQDLIDAAVSLGEALERAQQATIDSLGPVRLLR